jgi:hypothetical protein
MKSLFTFPAGQSCRSALNFWAARQRRPTDDVKIFVLHRGEYSASDGCKWIGRVGAPRRPDAAARRPYLPRLAHYRGESDDSGG